MAMAGFVESTPEKEEEEEREGGSSEQLFGLSALFVATIEEAKDRVSQIELIFCAQLFPAFKSHLERHSQVRRALLSERDSLLQERESLRKRLEEECARSSLMADSQREATESMQRKHEQEMESLRLEHKEERKALLQETSVVAGNRNQREISVTGDGKPQEISVAEDGKPQERPLGGAEGPLAEFSSKEIALQILRVELERQRPRHDGLDTLQHKIVCADLEREKRSKQSVIQKFLLLRESYSNLKKQYLLLLHRVNAAIRHGPAAEEKGGLENREAAIWSLAEALNKSKSFWKLRERLRDQGSGRGAQSPSKLECHCHSVSRDIANNPNEHQEDVSSANNPVEHQEDVSSASAFKTFGNDPEVPFIASVDGIGRGKLPEAESNPFLEHMTDKGSVVKNSGVSSSHHEEDEEEDPDATQEECVTNKKDYGPNEQRESPCSLNRNWVVPCSDEEHESLHEEETEVGTCRHSSSFEHSPKVKRIDKGMLLPEQVSCQQRDVYAQERTHESGNKTPVLKQAPVVETMGKTMAKTADLACFASEDTAGRNKRAFEAKPVTVRRAKSSRLSWRNTRCKTDDAQAAQDPHDDFLNTPCEQAMRTLKGLTAAGEPPTPKQQGNNRSEEKGKKGKCRGDIIRSTAEERRGDSASKSNNGKQATLHKFVEPVRKKSEREKLQGVDCNQCRKFYDAVLAEDPDGVMKSRCEHHDAASRHRYRFIPPATPDGFWNIGFDTEA